VSTFDRTSGEQRATFDVPQVPRSSVVPYEDTFVIATAEAPELSTDRYDNGYVRRLELDPLRERWAKKVPPEPAFTLDRDAGELFVGGRTDEIGAYAVTDGSTRWETRLDEEVSRPAVGAKRLYFGAMNGHLLAVDRSTGEELWRYTTPDSFYNYSGPVLRPGRVYAPNFDGHLYVLDRDTGDLQWQFRADDRLVSAPSVTDDRLFSASEAGTVYARET
jgi:outer membrane protein assembly factor BamB